MGDSLVFAYRCIIFTDAVQSLSGGVFSGANLDRLGSIPSTSRILLISEKFCEARAFSFGTGHKTKSKFYPKFLGEGTFGSLSLDSTGKGLKAICSR